MLDTILDNLTWLGHDSFRLRTGGKTLYIDPFQLQGEHEPADLILVTHDHYDHCSVEDIRKIQTPGTIIVTEPMSAAKLTGRITAMAPEETTAKEGIFIETVPAYNLNKKFHPRANNWLGFIITVDGVRIYHAGDTDYIPEMRHFSVDIALLPVSGIYVMTAEEAALAARDIKPEVAIPMHYAAIVGSTNDAERFAAELKGIITTRILTK